MKTLLCRKSCSLVVKIFYMKKKITEAIGLQEFKILTRNQMKEIKGGITNSLKPCSTIICSEARPCPTSCPACNLSSGNCGE
jgi:hypothetical protein